MSRILHLWGGGFTGVRVWGLGFWVLGAVSSDEVFHTVFMSEVVALDKRNHAPNREGGGSGVVLDDEDVQTLNIKP